jgi:hypothetical protein
VKFIDVLMASRRREQSQALQERIAAYGLYPPHRNVKAVPIRPPVKKDDKRA